MKTVHKMLLVLVAASLACGCVIVRKGAARVISPMATQLSEGLMHQSDIELVREGSPAFLLMLDALAEAHPDNAAVLVAAADAQMAYATAFVARDQKERATAMYAKAKTYGLRALSRNRRFAAAREAPQDEFEAALRSFRKRDAETLFTTASAWVMWIIANSESPAALGEMPRALALMRRVQELAPDIRQGGVDLFYGIYYTVLPLGGGRDLDRARMHFERAMATGGPDYLMAPVTFAEFYARYAFDEVLFKTTLQAVLAANPQRPEYTLMNAVAKTRAQGLLDRMDELF